MVDWPEILAKHGDRVWRTAYRILNHAADTQDCYQDTFLAAWKVAAVRPVEHWGAMLTCLATRKAIDRLRNRIRTGAITHPLDLHLEPAALDDPACSLRLGELIGQVRHCLGELPEKQAEVVWLRCVEDLTSAEIASQMQISSVEVRVLLHRGRSKLARQLAPELTDSQEPS